MARFRYLWFYVAIPAIGIDQTGAAAFQNRRQTAVEKGGGGIILLHANSGMKHWEEGGFHQDPNFYYFTGLRNAQGAILAIDGTSKESWLFVRPKMGNDKDLPGLDAVFPLPGSESESAFVMEHVVPWKDFVVWLDARQSANPQLIIYLDSGGQTGGQMGDAGNPEGLAPVFNPYLLWKNSVHSRWPTLAIKDAFPMLDEIRQVKSADEIAALRKAAAITSQGFWAAAAAIAPGRTQRQIEGEVLRACLQAGANGPSLWPWIRSGPNSLGSALFAAFFDSTNLDRVMKAGDIVRVDLGCDSGMYKGDLGRTVPVTGHFDAGQKEALDLLTGATWRV
jgi:Xaa-Pro aminopeptidase